MKKLNLEDVCVKSFIINTKKEPATKTDHELGCCKTTSKPGND